MATRASTPPQIALVGNYLPDGQESMIRYAQMLQRIVTEAGYDAHLVTPPAVLGLLPLGRGAARKWIGYLDKYLFGPVLLRWMIRNAELVHVCDHSNAMYLGLARRRPSLITCHDLIAVSAARGRYKGVLIGRTGRILQNWIATSLARAQNVVSVSHKTDADLHTIAPAMKACSRVIHNPLNWSYSPASRQEVIDVLCRIGVERGPYILHVGGNQWYKNRLGAMKIFAQLAGMPDFENLTMVMVGKPWTAPMRSFHVSSGLGKRLIEVPNVGNEVLCALYTGAEALLFPSLEEGFGWPIAEAQACGCPVITTNRPPMTEVAGPAAILIDIGDTSAAAERIHAEWLRRQELREAGFINVQRFSAGEINKEYANVYVELLRKRDVEKAALTAVKSR